MMNNTSRFQRSWPYPFWIAHRGGGNVAPENTLAAFSQGHRLAYKMFECDCKVNHEKKLFLLHDNTLDRTSNGQGTVYERNWQDLARLDMGSWMHPKFAGEAMPELHQIVDYCNAQGLALNIEIKPCLGKSAMTGWEIAQFVAEHPFYLPPLLTSFQPLCLQYPLLIQANKGLLCEQWDDANTPIKMALHLDCQALVAHYPLWTPERINTCHQLGLRCLSYTVNTLDLAHQLMDWQIDGLITDELNLLSSLLP